MKILSKNLCLLSVFLLPNILLAQDKPSSLEEVLIVGSKQAAESIAGSVHFIGAEQLDKFEYVDIQRIAREIPGVSLQIEDGYGLRPNISIRGVATERSGRITLLEDNVLIAPAPYSAPAAYYFPTAGRMQAFEVVKGPAAITQGPYTIGGALNMVSTGIPELAQGKLLLEYGEDQSSRIHLNYGEQTAAGFGYLLETHLWKSDGFQKIDNSERNSGLDVQDFMVKLAYAPKHSKHAIELKLQRAEQVSNQSYLGLTDNDFRQSPNRRYALSELDEINTLHDQAILRYRYEFSDDLVLTSSVYNNQHERDWFKTEGIDFDGSGDAQSFSRTSWANVINAINTGSGVKDTYTAAYLQSVLDGDVDTPFGSVQIRSNSREYFSRGIQFAIEANYQTSKVRHQLEFGIRYHEDQESRLQRNSTYQQLQGKLVLNDLGELGNAGNRVQDAQAIAVHVQDQMEFGNWLVTPGLRYESIDQQRTRFRGGSAREFRDSRENHTSILLPGIGVIYKLADDLSVVVGAHKGFTAPSNAAGARPEEAINYEAGVRYKSDSWNAELFGFWSDYENLLGTCTASSGVDCEIGDAFNGDAATVKGLELLVGRTFSTGSQISMPVSLSYTYIDGKFDTDIADTDFFGDVQAGSPIPYIPSNQFQLSVGLEGELWQVNANISRVDEVCTRSACGVFERTDAFTTIDLAGQYLLSPSIKLFARLENSQDRQVIAGRQPYGARPGKSRTAALGLEVEF